MLIEPISSGETVRVTTRQYTTRASPAPARARGPYVSWTNCGAVTEPVKPPSAASRPSGPRSNFRSIARDQRAKSGE